MAVPTTLTLTRNVSMNIYILESTRQKFKPTFLMIKQHNITGLKYLCKTMRKDPIKYKGSGTRWRRHITKHGSCHVTTIWYKLYTDIDALVNTAIALSELFDVTSSEYWANLKPETGLDGGSGATFTDIERKKRSERVFGANNPMFGTSRVGTTNPFYNKVHSKESKDKMGPYGQNMPESQKNATKKRMLVYNPMNNPESIQKIKNSMASACCILCREIRVGEQNMHQHYDSKTCRSKRKN